MIAMIEGLDSSEYTPESWAKAEEALAAAKAVEADPEATRQELDAAVNSLVAAFGGLEYGVQKIHLEIAIAAAEEILALSADYEDTTALAAAVEAGKKVLSNVEATQEDVDAAADAVLDELFKLAKRADLQSLESLIAAAGQLQKDKYTSDSFAALAAAIENAETVVADQNREPGDIANAYAQLVKAIKGLEMKGNKAALEAMIEKAEEILSTAEAYVSSTIEGLEETLAQAQAVYEDEDAVQSEVNEAVETLTKKVTQARLLGDVNGDGEINTGDTTAVLRASAEIVVLSDYEAGSADVNGDGEVNTDDAALILKYAAERIEKF